MREDGGDESAMLDARLPGSSFSVPAASREGEDHVESGTREETGGPARTWGDYPVRVGQSDTSAVRTCTSTLVSPRRR